MLSFGSIMAKWVTSGGKVTPADGAGSCFGPQKWGVSPKRKDPPNKAGRPAGSLLTCQLYWKYTIEHVYVVILQPNYI